MEIKKTEMFCLNATLTRMDAEDEKHNTETVAWSQKKNHGEASVILRVDDFDLTDEQATKLKAVHERLAAEALEILGW